ncbi:MAG TPA: cell division protein, partial [Caulobacteraceae bacterium]
MSASRRTRLIDRRVHGVRVTEIAAGCCLAVLILGVYLAKAGAASERAEIGRVESDIAATRSRIRLLQAEAAHLEEPGRIERLSAAHLGMKPVVARREAGEAVLTEIARAAPAPQPAPVVIVAAPAPAPAPSPSQPAE